MDLDSIFKALADPTRRHLLEELNERDGQTLFELTVRLVGWHDAAPSRQALSKHLAILEAAGLIRIEWKWRSKHHFLERAPLRRMWKVWLRPLSGPSAKGEINEDRCDERAG